VDARQSLGFSSIKRTTTWRDEKVETSTTTFDNRLVTLDDEVPLSLGFLPTHDQRIVELGDGRKIIYETRNTWTSRTIDHGDVRTGVVEKVYAVSSVTEVSSTDELTTLRSDRSTSYDQLGRPSQIESSTTKLDGVRHSTVMSKLRYTNDLHRWLIHQRVYSETDREREVGGEVTRANTWTESLERDPVTAAVLISAAGPVGQALSTYYRYDQFGNVVEQRAKAAGESDRYVRNLYDESGTFVTCSVNALGHVAAFEYDQTFGVATTTRDINGLDTTQQIDGFGRPVHVASPDGFSVDVEYTSTWLGPFRLETTKTTAIDGSFSSTTLDERGWVAKSESPTFGGDTTFVQYEYDPRGRLILETQPRIQGEDARPARTATYHRFSRNHLRIRG